MIVLASTSDVLRVRLGAAVATNQLQGCSIWRDITTSAYTPGRTNAITNNTSNVALTPSPGASTQRVIDYLSVFNSDTANATVTIALFDGAVEVILFSSLLGPGEKVEYVEGVGFRVLTNRGAIRSSPIATTIASNVLMCPHFATANLTTQKSITSTNTFAVYVGKAPRSLTTAQIRFRVSTIAATVTWAEVALAKGAINVGAGPILIVVGWADVAPAVTVLGQKTQTITVSGGQSINEGDDLWVLIGNQASTVCQVRAQSIADDLQVGLQGSAVMRPSLNVGVGISFTIESATTVAPWVALII